MPRRPGTVTDNFHEFFVERKAASSYPLVSEATAGAGLGLIDRAIVVLRLISGGQMFDHRRKSIWPVRCPGPVPPEEWITAPSIRISFAVTLRP
jgi:hypothetical protein